MAHNPKKDDAEIKIICRNKRAFHEYEIHETIECGLVLTGTLLLREVRHRYGVDVASEDINLDALASLATLAGFIQAARR